MKYFLLSLLLIFPIYGHATPEREQQITITDHKTEVAELPRVAPLQPVETADSPKQTETTTSDSPDLLERIAKCESGGSYTAQNRSSTASGRYQFLDSSWGGYGGYARAKDAPPAVQDAKARETFARRGSQPWAASRGCWG